MGAKYRSVHWLICNDSRWKQKLKYYSKVLFVMGYQGKVSKSAEAKCVYAGDARFPVSKDLQQEKRHSWRMYTSILATK